MCLLLAVFWDVPYLITRNRPRCKNLHVTETLPSKIRVYITYSVVFLCNLRPTSLSSSILICLQSEWIRPCSTVTLHSLSTWGWGKVFKFCLVSAFWMLIDFVQILLVLGLFQISMNWSGIIGHGATDSLTQGPSCNNETLYLAIKPSVYISLYTLLHRDELYFLAGRAFVKWFL